MASNLKNYRHNWVWLKNNPVGFLNAKKQPLRVTEDILVFARATPTYNPQGLIPCLKHKSNKRKADDVYEGGLTREFYRQEWTNYPRQVLQFSTVARQRSVHPTQKPVALMEYLINTYSSPGDTVLDNCMGSGTTGVACKALGRSFIGIEQDAGYFETARKRLGLSDLPQ